MFLDTANITDIQQYLPTGVFKGITTNPTLLKRSKVKDRFAHFRLMKNLAPEIIYIQLHGVTYEEFMEDYARLKKEKSELSFIGLKIPINTEGLKAIREIKKQDNEISVLGTAIYSADQAILAAHAGCDYIAPYIKRMERADLTPYETIKAVRGYLDREELPTKIMGASFESAEQVIKILDAGAHTVTISPEVYREMAEKQIANNAITVFNEDALSLR